MRTMSNKHEELNTYTKHNHYNKNYKHNKCNEHKYSKHNGC